MIHCSCIEPLGPFVGRGARWWILCRVNIWDVFPRQSADCASESVCSDNSPHNLILIAAADLRHLQTVKTIEAEAAFLPGFWFETWLLTMISDLSENVCRWWPWVASYQLHGLHVLFMTFKIPVHCYYHLRSGFIHFSQGRKLSIRSKKLQQYCLISVLWGHSASSEDVV